MKRILRNCMILFVASIINFSCKQDQPKQKIESSTPSMDCMVDGTKDSSTNPTIVALKESMVAFRNSLSEELRTKASVCLDDERFYLWHNTPANNRGKRDGISYGDLTEDQLNDFKSLMQLFLSADGYKKVNDITVLSEGWLNEIKSEVWNPNFYSIDMFGDPEQSGSWGFQLDGHHCVVNFLVNGDHVSIVPAFLGGEPAKEVFDGQSFDIFKEERDLALTLYNHLSQEELERAVTTSSERSLKVGPADRTGEKDPYIGDFDYSVFKTGLKYSSMSEEAKNHLILLMKEYVYNLKANFADIWWEDINQSIDETYFVWIDNVDQPSETSQFYYRIYNPNLWVEFNTEDVTGANANNMESWNHIHSITRVPNNTTHGGDYGPYADYINQNDIRFLQEHYANVSDHEGSLKFDYEL